MEELETTKKTQKKPENIQAQTGLIMSTNMHQKVFFINV
jgi:hypothetical protein